MGSFGLQWVVMEHQLTPILLTLLFLSACGTTRTPPPPPAAAPSVAQATEVRAWALKAYWAESKDDIAEALRCWKWVLRLDGANPEAKAAAKAFAERNGIDF